MATLASHLSDLAAAIRNKINAMPHKYAVTIGDGAATSFTITHNLGSRDVVVMIYEAAGGYAEVIADVAHTTINTVTVTFAVKPTANQYRVVVIG